MKLNVTYFICFVLRFTTDFLLLLFFLNLQFVVVDRRAPERVKGLKEERQRKERKRKGERTSRAQTAWQHFHEKLNRIAGSKQEGNREFLCCDVVWCRPQLELREGVASGPGLHVCLQMLVFSPAMYSGVKIKPTAMSVTWCYSSYAWYFLITISRVAHLV